MKDVNKYIILRNKLIKNAYDDDHGITLTRKEFEEEQKRFPNSREFVPQWFDYEEVLELIAVVDKILEKMK